MGEQRQPVFDHFNRTDSTPGDARWGDLYQPLANLLFSIGFLGASTRRSAAPRFVLDDALLLSSKTKVEEAEFFYVHRTYHSGLEIRVAADSQ